MFRPRVGRVRSPLRAGFRRDGAHGVTRPTQVAAAVGRLGDKSKPNLPRACTNLCEQDSAECNWFSRPVRDDRGGDDQKSRVANLRRTFLATYLFQFLIAVSIPGSRGNAKMACK